MDMVKYAEDVCFIKPLKLRDGKTAERAEKRIEAVSKIKRIALKVTNAHDWVDQGSKPYLQASGGEKIARLFGISWRIGEPVCEEIEGGHFIYTYKGEFSLSGVLHRGHRHKVKQRRILQEI